MCFCMWFLLCFRFAFLLQVLVKMLARRLTTFTTYLFWSGEEGRNSSVHLQNRLRYCRERALQSDFISFAHPQIRNTNINGSTSKRPSMQASHGCALPRKSAASAGSSRSGLCLLASQPATGGTRLEPRAVSDFPVESVDLGRK